MSHHCIHNDLVGLDLGILLADCSANVQKHAVCDLKHVRLMHHRQTAPTTLSQLKRAGKLRRHGPTKGGYWEVIGEDNE